MDPIPILSIMNGATAVAPALIKHLNRLFAAVAVTGISLCVSTISVLSLCCILEKTRLKINCETKILANWERG
jgi:hypothetical protein